MVPSTVLDGSELKESSEKHKLSGQMLFAIDERSG